MNHIRKFNEDKDISINESKLANGMDKDKFMAIVALGYESARYDHVFLEEDTEEYEDMLWRTWLSESGENLKPEQYQLPFSDREENWNKGEYNPPKQRKDNPFKK